MSTEKTKDLYEYQITDVLWMNYSKNPAAIREVKEQLLCGRAKNKRVDPLFAFATEGAIVVIQNGFPKRTKRLILLNSHKKSYQVLQV